MAEPGRLWSIGFILKNNYMPSREIEIKVKIERAEALQTFLEFLQSHDCGAIERNYVGYPFLLLFPERQQS